MLEPQPLPLPAQAQGVRWCARTRSRHAPAAPAGLQPGGVSLPAGRAAGQPSACGWPVPAQHRYVRLCAACAVAIRASTVTESTRDCQTDSIRLSTCIVHSTGGSAASGLHAARLRTDAAHSLAQASAAHSSLSRYVDSAPGAAAHPAAPQSRP